MVFDGARSALVAVMTGLLVLFIYSKENRKLILQSCIYIFSFFVYKITIFLAEKYNDCNTNGNIAARRNVEVCI